MNIHLYRSDEVDPERFFNVVDYLAQFPGPVKFVTDEKPVHIPDELQHDEPWDEKRMLEKEVLIMETKLCYQVHEEKIVTWPDLFGQIRRIREHRKIRPEEPVVLITDLRNEHNWFSAADPKGANNFFIQSSQWDWYIEGDPRYPIAYELVALPIRMQMHDTFQDLVESAHHDSRGCMNDFCQNKRDIGFKLRSADICTECLEALQKRQVDPLMLRQAFRVMDDIRSQLLFRERFSFTRQPSRIRIAGRMRRFQLTDLGNLEIHLMPMEKTVYLFFLNHPEGVAFSYMPDHHHEIRQLYGQVSNTDTVALLETRSRAICTNQDDCLSQIISRIRSKLVSALGEEMAQPYLIQGEPGQKRRILLDRSLVELEP